MILPVMDENHKYWLGSKHIISVTQVMQLGGIIDVSHYTEEARDRGTVVHKCINYINQGDLDLASIDERVRGYVAAYEMFLLISGIKIKMTETVVMSQEYEYCGTLDIMGVMNSRPVIIDCKTGSVPSWCGIQLAAYNQAFQEGGGPKCARFSLQLGADGKFKVREHKNSDDFFRFKLALENIRRQECQPQL